MENPIKPGALFIDHDKLTLPICVVDSVAVSPNGAVDTIETEKFVVAPDDPMEDCTLIVYDPVNIPLGNGKLKDTPSGLETFDTVQGPPVPPLIETVFPVGLNPEPVTVIVEDAYEADVIFTLET